MSPWIVIKLVPQAQNRNSIEKNYSKELASNM
jgi:hypothetical protein